MSESDRTGPAPDTAGADLPDDPEHRGTPNTAAGGSDPEPAVLQQAHDTHTPADATASAEDAAETPLTTDPEAQRDGDEDPIRARNTAS